MVIARGRHAVREAGGIIQALAKTEQACRSTQMTRNARKSGELTPIDTQHPIEHMQVHLAA
jgi:hypothetical protein